MSENTTIETKGLRDEQVVRLRYVYDEEKPIPEIEIVDGECFSEEVRERWLMEIDLAIQAPMDFRGLSLQTNDPVRVLAALVGFYDEPPEEVIDDPEGFFECDPSVTY